MQEIWKAVVGFNNYEVSNVGNVRSIERVEDFRGGKRKRKGSILSKRVILKYYSVNLKEKSSGVKSFTALVHRLVAMAFIPNNENKPCVNHIDANSLNNNVDNLEWCTQKENIHHAMKFDNWTRGENHGMAKLKQDDIKFIRDQEKSFLWLAKKFNVSYTTIKSIRTNKIWRTHDYK